MQANVPFDKRLKRIQREHNKMTKGVVRKVNRDGLIVTKPRGFRPRFPVKGLVAILILGFLFKGFLLAYLGPTDYQARVDALGDESSLERAGAWIMQPDPITMTAAAGIGAFLNGPTTPATEEATVSVSVPVTE